MSVIYPFIQLGLSAALIVLSLSRSEWWKFIPTCVILLLSCRKGIQSKIKVPSKKNLFIAFILYLAIYVLQEAIRWSASEAGVVLFQPQKFVGSMFGAISIASQTISEDILLRIKLKDCFSRFMQSEWVPLLFGLMFAILHFFLYFFGFENTSLSFFTLIVLFLFGYYSEYFIKKGYSLCWIFLFHFLWNREKFSGTYTFNENQRLLKEAEIFNLIEGSKITFFSAIIIVLVGSIQNIKKRRKVVHVNKNGTIF